MKRFFSDSYGGSEFQNEASLIRIQSNGFERANGFYAIGSWCKIEAAALDDLV